MNFFENQQKARRKSGILAIYFAAAVLMIVLAVDAVVVVAISSQNPRLLNDLLAARMSPGHLHILLWTSLATLAVIVVSTLWKMSSLSSGGGAVAEMLGGRLVPPDTRDMGERRLLNVVEEMALAAGMPVPAVYVLPEERGINAFAAGYSPATAAVTVSRGALDVLTRDELQGVVAHEFSHIFNGDMRLNLRLIGLLSGILVIALVGRGILQGMGRSRPSGNNKDSGGGAVIALSGLGLLAIGYIGVFFAQLIKSAISRQREYLADASAVQFTRNPSGIVGALIKIRDGEGSTLSTHRAEEVSHLLFASGVSSLFATHPPLNDRIRAIDPNAELEHRVQREEIRPAAKATATATDGAASFAPSSAAPRQAVDTVGKPTAEHLAAATQFLADVPEALRQRLRTAEGARAVVYSLLLDSREDLRTRQSALLGEESSAAAEVFLLASPLGSRARLPLAGMAAPALRGMPPAAKDAFLDRVHALIVEDNRVEPFELLMEIFLGIVLSPAGRPPDILYRSVRAVLREAMVVLSFLSYEGNPGRPEAAEAAFRRGLDAIEGGLRGTLVPEIELDPDSVRTALEKLHASDFSVRKQLIDACAACARADGRVTVEEWETLRVFSAAVDCPMPPLVDIVS